MTDSAGESSRVASSSSQNGVIDIRSKEGRRRRLQDLSFSSPGPAFTSSSDVGEDDSDVDGTRKRKARLSAIGQVSFKTSSTNIPPTNKATAQQTHSDPVKSSPLFRNFNNSMFRNFDQTASSSNGKHKKQKHSIDVSPRKFNGVANGQERFPPETSKNGHSVPGSSTTLPKVRTPSGVRSNGAINTASSSTTKTVNSSPTKQSDSPKREWLLARKKRDLDQVYREHDGLVRELFHLTKFVTYFGFDPDVAAQDRSDVFERFRMDYDLPTRLSGASGRATRRIVSAKRSDLDLKKEAEKKRLLTKVDTNGHVPASQSKNGKAKEKVETKRGRGKPRISTNSSDSSDESENEVDQRSITIPVKRGRKKAVTRAASSQSSSSSSEIEDIAVKKRAIKPIKKAVSPDYEPRPPVIMERIEGIPRFRVMLPSQLPPRSRHRGSLAKYLQSWYTTGELLGSAGEMEIVSLDALHQREKRDAMLYRAIENAKRQGLLQDREEVGLRNQQSKPIEVPKPSSIWDSLLQEIISSSFAKRSEARNKVAICKRVSRMVHLYWDEKLGRGERQKKVEERRIRALAKYTVREVRKQWKLAVNVIKARRSIQDKVLRDKAGREQLKTILEQSTQMLGKQHRTLVQGEAGGESETESENESDSEDGETEESDAESFTEEDDGGVEMEDEGEAGADLDIDIDKQSVLLQEKETASDDEMAEEEVQAEEEKEEESLDQVDGDHKEEIEEIRPDSDDVVAKIKPPFLLRGSLRPYQQIGFEWLASLYNNGSNGILADEMGLGKTIQTISVLAHLACDKGEWGPHLVVAPTSVMLNWEVEFKKFLPGFKILSYYGSQKERKEKRRGWNSDNHFNVCITSYQLVLADQHILRRKAWNYLILDEAHHIKNFKSQRWQTLLGFHSKRRLLLTGTPLQNNLMDLWSLMYFLMPNGVTSADGVVSSGFASMKEFQQWFSNPLGKAVESAGMEGDDGEVDDETRGMVSKLHTLLRPYLLRRLKADVEKELPNKYEHVIRCRLSKRQKFLYNDFMSRAKTRESLASGNYLSIINCLMQLRKVCNHPDLFEQRPIVTSFASQRSVVADYEIKELLVRRELLYQHDEDQVNLKALNLIFTSTDQQHLTPIITKSLKELDASASFPQSADADADLVEIDTWTVEGYKSSMARKRLAEKASHWKHTAYLNRLRCQSDLPSMSNESSVKTIKSMVTLQHLSPLSFAEQDTRNFLYRCDSLHRAVLSNDERREFMQDIIDRYAFVTPRAVTNDISKWALPGFNYETIPKEMTYSSFDTLHQPAVKLQIAFPDASLLQYDCGKLQELALLMQRCKSGGHRILIFTQMTKILDILETWLSLNGFKYLRLDGSTKVEDRQALTERFNRDDRIKAFILSTRSGGLGINLTGADMVLFWDLDWNFQIEAQCMDRAHRIGQTRDVHIYRFVSEHTIEENMLKKSNEKRMLDNMVIQNGQFTTEGLSKMSWIESMFDEGGKTIAGVQVGSKDEVNGKTSDRRIETAMNQAEDEEDARAAKQAQMELNLLDNDFEIEMSQDKQRQQEVAADAPGPGDVVNQVKEIDQDQAPAQEDEEDAGTVDDFMLKRVDAEWEYFVNL